MELDGWGGWNIEGGLGGWKTVIRIYCRITFSIMRQNKINGATLTKGIFPFSAKYLAFVTGAPKGRNRLST